MTDAAKIEAALEEASDEQLEHECRERFIWNDEVSIADFDTEELRFELDSRMRADGDSIFHRMRDAMRSGDRGALWELCRTEVQNELGVVIP